MSNLPIKGADKTHKHSQVDVINGDLQAGKLIVCRDNCQRLIMDLQVLEWDSSAMEKRKFVYRKGYADHLADALQYGFHLSNHHTHDFQENSLDDMGTPAYWRRKEAEWEQRAIEQVEEQASDDQYVWDYLAGTA